MVLWSFEQGGNIQCIEKCVKKGMGELHRKKSKKENPFVDQYRVWYPYHGIDDPCPPRAKTYVVPPNQYICFQPEGLPQYSAREALYRGTLWPIFRSPYPPIREGE